MPTTLSAVIWPALVFCKAEANDKVPPNKKIVLRSIALRASFSDMTPVKIKRIAPMLPVT